MRWLVHGHTTSVTSQCSPSLKLFCRRMTSPGCRFVHVHRSSIFRCCSLTANRYRRENKKPRLRFSKQGERKSISILTCLHRVYPNYLRAFAQWVPWIVPGETRNPGYTGYDVSLSRRASSANSWLICSCKFSSNVPRRIAHVIGYRQLIL